MNEVEQGINRRELIGFPCPSELMVAYELFRKIFKKLINHEVIYLIADRAHSIKGIVGLSVFAAVLQENNLKPIVITYPKLAASFVSIFKGLNTQILNEPSLNGVHLRAVVYNLRNAEKDLLKLLVKYGVNKTIYLGSEDQVNTPLYMLKTILKNAVTTVSILESEMCSAEGECIKHPLPDVVFYVMLKTLYGNMDIKKLFIKSINAYKQAMVNKEANYLKTLLTLLSK